MQKVDLRNKSYEQIFIKKMELGQQRNFLFFIPFSFIFLFLFLNQVSIHSMS